MSTTTKHDVDPNSVTGLVSGILNDAQELFKQQVDLVKHEIRVDLRKARDASFALGAGTVAIAVGILLLANMVVHLLCAAWPQLPLWGSYGIVGGVFAVAGGAFLAWGKTQIEDIQLLSNKSSQALQESVPWITKPTTPT